MKVFNINNDYTIVCNFESTRYGFRHLASLLRNNQEIEKAKICYYNRTWESYEYESVITKLLSKHNELQSQFNERN